jgi:gluconokinase
LRFVYLEIGRDAAAERVCARPGHFFNAGLVDSQFAALEAPTGEDGVVCVSAGWSVERAVERVRVSVGKAPSLRQPRIATPG